MKQKIKQNKKVIVSFILGVLVSTTTVYATTILASKDVYHDNSKSGGSYATVQGAIEELYDKVNSCSSQGNSNFIVAYTYNQEKDASNYCVTGDEETCVQTDCYTSSSKTCETGTIVDYIVSGTNNRVRFHVMYDDGDNMTMQSQENIVNKTKWNTIITEGPLIILPALEQATSNWSNVNDQTYTMGTTVFKKNEYTAQLWYSGIDGSYYEWKNVYTLDSRTTKARIITKQEIETIGNCTTVDKTCPIWMYNYLYKSKSYGGTVNSSVTNNYGYWTMTVGSMNTYVFSIYYGGSFYARSLDFAYNGARAVVNVSK